MQQRSIETEVLCPVTGQMCIRKQPVQDRTTTVRRWTGGSVKAAVCSLDCAGRWAEDKGYIATGTSERHEGGGKSTAIVIVQHPDQVHSSIKVK